MPVPNARRAPVSRVTGTRLDRAAQSRVIFWMSARQGGTDTDSNDRGWLVPGSDSFRRNDRATWRCMPDPSVVHTALTARSWQARENLVRLKGCPK